MVMVEVDLLQRAADAVEASAYAKAWYSQQDNNPPALWTDLAARTRYRLALELRAAAGGSAERAALAAYPLARSTLDRESEA